MYPTTLQAIAAEQIADRQRKAAALRRGRAVALAARQARHPAGAAKATRTTALRAVFGRRMAPAACDTCS
jgi:hypothetical protein